MITRSVLAAGAVVSLTGTSFGFSLVVIGQLPGVSAQPSSGLFRFDTEGSGTSVYTSNPWLLSATSTQWSTESASILASSWIAVDAKGGPGNWSLGSGATNRPSYSDTNSNVNYPYLQTPASVDSGFQGIVGDTAANIQGGVNGWSFAPQRPGPIPGVLSDVTDLPIDILGNTIDQLESVYVGHFALTEAEAFLQGEFTVVMQTNAGEQIGPLIGFQLNLNGELNLGFRLAQVRGPGNTIDLYVVEGVPAPGAIGAFGLAGVIASRRRRE